MAAAPAVNGRIHDPAATIIWQTRCRPMDSARCNRTWLRDSGGARRDHLLHATGHRLLGHLSIRGDAMAKLAIQHIARCIAPAHFEACAVPDRARDTWIWNRRGAVHSAARTGGPQLSPGIGFVRGGAELCLSTAPRTRVFDAQPVRQSRAARIY